MATWLHSRIFGAHSLSSHIPNALRVPKFDGNSTCQVLQSNGPSFVKNCRRWCGKRLQVCNKQVVEEDVKAKLGAQGQHSVHVRGSHGESLTLRPGPVAHPGVKQRE